MCVEKSFLKWLGSKNRLIPQLLPHLPSGKRLIEPFVGAGNVFINTNYASYVLCDKNRDLINVYRWLRDDIARLLNETKSLFDSNPDFYDVRTRFNNSTLLLSAQRAAEFIYLNRHCFNGVCRYNAKGEFNVPIGQHKSIYFPKDELIAFSNKLISVPVELVQADFSAVIENAGIGDVIYCDPPYISDTDEIFTGYTPGKFDDETTRRLHYLLVLAVRRGATAVISNSNNSLVRDIFNNFEIYEVNTARSVAANGNRHPTREIIGVLTPEMVWSK